MGLTCNERQNRACGLCQEICSIKTSLDKINKPSAQNIQAIIKALFDLVRMSFESFFSPVSRKEFWVKSEKHPYHSKVWQMR